MVERAQFSLIWVNKAISKPWQYSKSLKLGVQPVRKAMKTPIMSTIAAAALVASAWAQAPDPHHPEGAAPGAAQPAPQSPAGMGGMAEMMRMMQGMRMMGQGMTGT